MCSYHPLWAYCISRQSIGEVSLLTNSEMLMGSEIKACPSSILYPETEFKAEAESDAEAEPLFVGKDDAQHGGIGDDQECWTETEE